MRVEVLVETGFLLALNPRDRHHSWALRILREAEAGKMILHISPIAPVELSLVMRSRGRSDEEVRRVLNALNTAIMMYTKPKCPPLGLGDVEYAAELRGRHPQLSFFDSLHAAIAINNKLTYYDLDEVVRDIILRELERG